MDAFKSFSVTKVSTVNSEFSDWQYNLKKFILPSIEGTSEIKQTSVAPILRPYANTPNGDEDLFENSGLGIVTFYVRKEEKKISASMFKKRIADFELRNQCKITKDERQEIKHTLYSTAPVKVDFVPVIVTMTGDVYIFSSSTNMVYEVRDICTTVFNFEYPNDEPEVHESSFLTWLWWKIENTVGSLVNVDKTDIDIILGESVKCQSMNGSISSKSVLEEARASLAKGADVTELETYFVDGEMPKKVIFTIFKDSLKGMSSKDWCAEKGDELENVNLAFLEVERAFKVRDELVKKHEKEQGIITNELRQNWGLKKFCPLLIGEF